MGPETMQTIERRIHQGGNNELESEYVTNIFRQIDILDAELTGNEGHMEYCRQNVILAVNSLLLYIQRINKENANSIKEHISENKDKMFYEFRVLLAKSSARTARCSSMPTASKYPHANSTRYASGQVDRMPRRL